MSCALLVDLHDSRVRTRSVRFRSARSGGNRQFGVLIATILCTAGCSSTLAIEAARDHVSVRSGRAVTVHDAMRSATLHFARGRRVLRFRLDEPSGVILLYRMSAPDGVRVRGSAQLPGITVPLRIATGPIGPGSACVASPKRAVCTVGEEWCPMPAGTWRFRVEKLGGPEADVSLSFRVGQPPRRGTS
jgi:hypothetical protein